MTNLKRLENDSQFYAQAERTLAKIEDRKKRFADNKGELEFLADAHRIIDEVVQTVQENNIPDRQKERRKAFWPLTGLIMDRQDPDVDGDIMLLANYYAIRGPMRDDLGDTLV